MKRLLLDMSSICWTSLLAGKDKEFGKEVEHNGRTVTVNSAQYGYENAMNMIVGAMKRFEVTPIHLVLVIEGHGSKALRRTMLDSYKPEDGDSRPPQAYDQFNMLKQMLCDALLAVGASAVTQPGVEADDVLAYLAQTLVGEKVIVTGDGDLAVLVGPTDNPLPVGVPGTNEGYTHLWRRGELDGNPYGPFPNKFITLYKALVGDTSDGYIGAKGFGEKAFLDLLCVFGDEGLALMEDLIVKRQIKRLEEDVADLPSLKKVIEAEDMVYKCYAVAKLYPNMVNTLRNPLQWSVGMVKPAMVSVDERLKSYHQQVRLVHAGNYNQAMQFATQQIKLSPFVALDIETSTSDESDEWMKKRKGNDDGNATGVDVFGSELTGLSLTFGPNNQYTFYLTHDHVEEPGVKNLTIDQVREFCELIPKGMKTVIQNVAFELPVLYMEWGEKWKNDPEWHGFLPNAYDTKILGSYVDENISKGLKKRSLHYLGYTQESYAEVTTMVGTASELPPGGTVLDQTELEPGVIQLRKQYKMRELTANHVLSYGADDTICTAALFNHYRMICELENTWRLYEYVEILPAYLTALSFVQGTPFSLERMKEIEAEDDIAYDKAWATIRAYLIEHGWEGTSCPVFTDLEPASVKALYKIITGDDLETKVRKLDKLVLFIRSLDHEHANLFAKFLEEGNLAQLNDWAATCFDGEPKLDIGSPKQMKHLLYDVMKLPVRIINDATDIERKEKPALASACSRHKKIQQGSTSIEPLTDEEKQLLKAKAKTDDTAVDFALLLDKDVAPVEVLKALQAMKKVDTRRKLFYRPYANVAHWKDGLIHSYMNQSEAVTRRYSSSDPNLQQLPKKGEGVRFRSCFLPHHKNAVVCSVDFSGQELRLAAWRSQDANMLACYIGENKKDIHSITAAGAMVLKWGEPKVKEMVASIQEAFDPSSDEALYRTFVALRKAEVTHKESDDLRKEAKNVNFAAQFGALAPKIAETLIMPLADAQLFLDARSRMFPDVQKAADRATERAKKFGYATTLMGGRRHLQSGILSPSKWDVERAARQAWNMEIQGSAAEQTKIAMGNLWRSGALFKYDARLIGPIHDELVTSVAVEHAVEFIRIKNFCMTQKYADMEIEVLGSISLGPDFANQIECGDTYDAAAIAKALATVTKERKELMST